MILQFDDAPEGAERKGRGYKLFGAALFGVALMLGQTFAANIGIGTGGAVEFGQGIQATTACSGSNPITIKPATSFANSSGAGSMKFSAIEVSGIPTSCQGSKFVFTAYQETATAALPIFDSNKTSAVVIMRTDNTYSTIIGASGLTVTTLSSSSFRAEFATPASDSKLVYRLTVESLKSSCAEGSSCVIGDIGPGGGRIFLTPSTSGNTTGLYFEVAPVNVSGSYSLCLTEPFAISRATTIGSGETNTAALMTYSNCNTSATGAYAATNYQGGGLNDWFLPSKDEAIAIKTYAGTFYTNWGGNIMSSTENDGRGVWIVDPTGQTCGTNNCTTYKNFVVPVRPVRSF